MCQDLFDSFVYTLNLHIIGIFKCIKPSYDVEDYCFDNTKYIGEPTLYSHFSC